MSTNKASKATWVITLIILALLAIAAYLNSDSFASISFIEPKFNIVREDPPPAQQDISEEKIALLSKYIKSRKSVTPQEVADKIAYEIITQCNLNNMADDIVVGIIEIESMWNIYATSKAKAKGLMQILIEDGVEIDHKKAYNIGYNIEKGIAIFKSKLKKAKGDVTLALKYYVGGDVNYHKAVYRYLGKYTLYKINNSRVEILKVVKVTKG
jgi:hypothetical protein